jgi:opacity protein-like surface antigen
MPSTLVPWSVCLALLAAPGLRAEDLDDATHFGLQATAALPRQELRDVTGRTGLGGGIFFEADQEGGWSLRTRFDFIAFREDRGRTQTRLASFVPPAALRVSANQFSAGVEVRYRVPGLKGAFVLGGVTGSRLEFETVLPGTGSGPAWGKEKTSFKLGLAAGAGYRLGSSSSITFRYTATNLGGITLAALEAGLDCRF